MIKMKIRTIKELKGKIKDKKVLVRTDYNVPLKYKGKRIEIDDDFRIRISLETLKFLRREGARITIITHLGRPKGKDAELSLEPIAKKLSKLLRTRVILIKDYSCIEEVLKWQTDEIILLENLRYNEGEEKNSKRFARKIAKHFDLFVFDAFSTAHRKHASTYQIPSMLKTYAGFRFVKEVQNLNKVLKTKKKIGLIIGGLKINTKIGLINNLADRSKSILIGGAMMFTFLKAQGKEIGKSIFKEDEIKTANKIIKNHEKKLVLPKDAVCALKREVKTKKQTRVFSTEEIPKNYIGLDIGPKTVKLFKEEIAKSKVIVWNGPLGYYENKLFVEGTAKIMRWLSKQKSYRLICGGDTATVVRKLKLDKKFDFVSSGGGASLFFLSGKKFPIMKFIEKQ